MSTRPALLASTSQALSGLRVLDLSRWVAGEYASKLFADFGAQVTKVEKPDVGSLTRRWGPFPKDRPDLENSALFLHLNTNKRSIALDLRSPADHQMLLELVRRSDVLIESFRPGQMEKLRIGPDVLRAANPALVITRISAFGQSGPYRDYEATGLILQAMGGPMNATGGVGGAPLRKPGLLEHYTIGRSAAQATAAAALLAAKTGQGSVIDISGQEVLLAGADRRASYLMSAAFSGMIAPRGVRSAHRSGTTFTGPFKASDGYVMLYVTTKNFWNRLVHLIADADQTFLDKYLDRINLGADWDAFTEHVAAWCSVRPKIEIMELGENARIPLTALLEISELRAHEHFRGRNDFVIADHPVAGELEYLGAPWRMKNGFALRRTAPLLDEDSDVIRAELAVPLARPVPAVVAKTAPQTKPLAGVRVIDLTVVWSGPGGTALLGDLGAEVIRLEGNNRMSRQVSAKVTLESIRQTGYHGGTYPDKDPGERPYDRTALFAWHARNKLSACMNLETPEGREAALELVKISDVLVENNSNGTLEKLGLGHEELLALNPRLIVARMPPMGMTGPMSDYLGYGPNFNALVGIAAMDGYQGCTPDSAGENYHMDEAAPAGLAFAVTAALRDRDRTGVGGLLEFAQAENVMQEIGEFVLDHQMNGRNPQILGNADPHSLQDVFPALGTDQWVAVSVRHDQDWRAMVELIGHPELLQLGIGQVARTANAARLLQAVADWTVTASAADAARACQAAGVPAAKVMNEMELLDDPHLAERKWFQQRTHSSLGTYRFPGHPWRALGFDTDFGRPLPGFGEDNEYVYLTLLGYSRQKYEELQQRGLVTDVQLA